MVAKLLITGLTTAGTDGMELTFMMIMMGQRKEDKYDVEAYLHCADFDVHKEEVRKIWMWGWFPHQQEIRFITCSLQMMMPMRRLMTLMEEYVEEHRGLGGNIIIRLDNGAFVGLIYSLLVFS